jgi:hypothetical protein
MHPPCSFTTPSLMHPSPSIAPLTTYPLLSQSYPANRGGPVARGLVVALLMCGLMLIGACSPRHLIIQGVANELASQGSAVEDDLVLAREASAFYLKLSESLLSEDPGNLKLAEAVSAGFTQYAFAFVASEAERVEAKDTKAAQKLRERAARLYLRAQRHGTAALETTTPGFSKALAQASATQWPALNDAQIGVAYWAAASWGGYISLSKDNPDTIADLPLAIRLASLAYAIKPGHGDGALAGLRAR